METLLSDRQYRDLNLQITDLHTLSLFATISILILLFLKVNPVLFPPSFIQSKFFPYTLLKVLLERAVPSDTPCKLLSDNSA